MRGLFHCKARASYIVCRAQSKRKMLTKSIFFFHGLFLQCIVDGQCPGISTFISRYIKYWNQEWKGGFYKDTCQICSAVVLSSQGRRDCLGPPWEPIRHASDQTVPPPRLPARTKSDDRILGPSYSRDAAQLQPCKGQPQMQNRCEEKGSEWGERCLKVRNWQRSTLAEKAEDSRSRVTWSKAPSFQYMLICPIQLHLQSKSWKINH